MSRPLLVSFKFCPYAHRAAIALREKGVDFELRHIMPSEKPDWFLEISPLGQVPVLQTERGALFDSVAIAEYIDDTLEPRLHPADPWLRAQNRSWIAFSVSVLDAFLAATRAPDEAGMEAGLATLEERLDRLESRLGEGPWFNGADYSLVDAAYAPMVFRLRWLEGVLGPGLLADRPRLAAWTGRLLERESTVFATPPELEGLIRMGAVKAGGVLGRRLSD